MQGAPQRSEVSVHRCMTSFHVFDGGGQDEENLSFNLEAEPSNMFLLTLMTIMKRSGFLKRPP